MSNCKHKSHPTALPSVGYAVILDCLILENWTDMLSRNVCNYDSVLRKHSCRARILVMNSWVHRCSITDHTQELVLDVSRELKNLLLLQGFKPRTSNPWPSRYTDKLLRPLTYKQVTIFRCQRRLYSKSKMVELFSIRIIQKYIYFHCGPGSSVGIATDYGLDGLGSNPGEDEIFRPSGAHPAFCKMGTGSFPGVKCGRGVLLTTHPLLVPLSWKSRAVPPVTGSLYHFIFLFIQKLLRQF